jgi:hypothetical protein
MGPGTSRGVSFSMALCPPWGSALREELNSARQKGKWQARNRYLNGEQNTSEEKELEEEERVLEQRLKLLDEKFEQHPPTYDIKLKCGSSVTLHKPAKRYGNFEIAEGEFLLPKKF